VLYYHSKIGIKQLKLQQTVWGVCSGRMLIVFNLFRTGCNSGVKIVFLFKLLVMDKKKLKEELHQYIDKLEDETALSMLHEATVEYEKTGEKDIVEDLTPEQQARLKESLEQLNSGQWKSHEEVMKEARTWLRK
jgi:predicted transcriptional regulator